MNDLLKVWDLLNQAAGSAWEFTSNREFRHGDHIVRWTSEGWMYQHETRTVLLDTEEAFQTLDPLLNPMQWN